MSSTPVHQLSERLDIALEAGQLGLWEWNIVEGRVFWSDTLQRIHGLVPGSFKGTFEEYQSDIHPDDLQRVLGQIEHTMAGQPHHLTYRIVRPDGEVRWLDARGRLIRDESGQPLRLVGICMDATERIESARQLEEQAAELEAQREELSVINEELQQTNDELAHATTQAESAERYVRGILGAIADPFVVHDNEWRFRFINDAAREVFRVTEKGDLIGKVVWEQYPELLGTRFESEMKRAVAQRKLVVFEEYYPERATWSEMRCYPLPDGGLATVWRDTTQQRRAEETLHYLSKASAILSESLDWQTTLQAIAQLVVPHLADWCSVEVVENGESRQVALAHVDPAKVEWAKELNKRYPPDRNAPTGVPQVLRSGRPEFYPEIPEDMLRAGAQDEEHFRIMQQIGFSSALIVPLTARDRVLGAVTLVTAESRRRYTPQDLALAEELASRAAISLDNAMLYRDAVEAREQMEQQATELEAQTEELRSTQEELEVTNEELRESNEALARHNSIAEDARRAAEAANRAKSDFLARMSHDLRTPLNAIGGYTQLVELGIHGPVTDAQLEAMSRIRRAQEHLITLINDILSFAKLESGEVEFEEQDIAVVDILAEIRDLVQPQAELKGIAYADRCRDPDVRVLADRDRLAQVLLNLLTNAVKFTEPQGRIELSCDTEGDHVILRVSDTGRGIPSERLEVIFDPFVQAGRSSQERREGVGLGLAISRELAERMGGSLTVESEVGKGSTFSVSLRRGRQV